jgi:hypothetical protein
MHNHLNHRSSILEAWNTVYLLWLLVMGALIFLMQAGFFLLEGRVRAWMSRTS